MLVLFRVRAARALKREIPNPPYQGGKATEAIRGELACWARLKAYELRYGFIKAITEGCRTARYDRSKGGLGPSIPDQHRTDMESSGGNHSYTYVREHYYSSLSTVKNRSWTKVI